MKKIIKSLFVSITLGVASLTSIYIFDTFFINDSEIDIINEKFIATITGAVSKPGDYEFRKNQTTREIIFKANVKFSADINLLNLEHKQNQSFEINVPYKIGERPKLKYSEITTINQLKAIGVKDNIAKIIIKYKNENKGIPTWDEIDNLSGIGEKTLAFLKENIDLF
ncbi:MAG: MAG0490 family ComEA-like DNA-binding protein [Metamycoplasmataceae bacterium]